MPIIFYGGYMKGLECSTLNCEHNVMNCCTAGIINISSKGFCATKMKRDGGMLAQSFKDMEVSEELRADLKERDNLVQCEASCRFNDNFKCTAPCISIQDGIIHTKCYTRK